MRASLIFLALLVAAVIAFDAQLVFTLKGASSTIGDPFTRRPENTVGSDGLVGLTHTTTPDGTFMWLSAPNQHVNAWLVYQLQATSKLTGVRIFNYNEVGIYNGKQTTLRSTKDAEIFVSTDGATFTSVWSGTFPLAPGNPTTNFNFDINLPGGGYTANYVRILCKNNYGGDEYIGLSKVRFYGTADTQIPTVDADLVGHWAFQANQNGNDLRGNFQAFTLKGTATFTSGGLKVTGAGTSSTAWGVAGTYTGPTVSSRATGYTIAACGTLDSFNAAAGSLTTFDRISGDQFDGVVFGELQTHKWMQGSSGYSRTTNFVPGFEETTTGQRVFVAVTSTAEGASDRIKGYRGLNPNNAAQALEIGSYTNSNIHSWFASDGEVFFGLRHGSTSGGPGALDATVHESWIYRRALTPTELATMARACMYPPAPAVVAFCTDISTKCASLSAECTTLHGGVGGALASDCDAAAQACQSVHSDCQTKIENCPLQ